MSIVRLSATLVFVLAMLVAPAGAQETTDTAQLDELRGRVKVVLAGFRTDEAVLSKLRTDLEAVQQQAVTQLPELEAKLAKAQAAVEALGEPPAEGAEPEPAEIAERRQKHNADVEKLDLAVKRSELARTEAGDLITQIVDHRRQQFADALFAKSVSPAKPLVWTTAVAQLGRFATRTVSHLSDQVANGAQTMSETLPFVLLAIVLGIVVGFPIRSRLITRVKRDPGAEPNYSEKVAAAGMLSASRAIPGILSAGAGYFALQWSGLLGSVGLQVALTALGGLIGFLLTAAIARSSLAPTRSNWRLIDISDAAARRAVILLTCLAAVYAVQQTLNLLYDLLGTGQALLAVHNLIFGTTVAALVIAVARKSLWTEHEMVEALGIQTKPASRLATWLGRGRWIVMLAALAIPITALLGYRNISEFIAARLVITSSMMGLLFLIHLFASDSITRGFGVQTDQATEGRDGRGLSAFLLIICIDLILLFIALVALLPLWGATSDDLASWINKALFGFRVGDVTISLVSIVIAVAVFGVILMVTKVLQHVLSERLLPMTRVDSGVRDSLRTALGYAGFILAASIGLSFAGFDLSKLAFVAGALSIGIGFGLQNVVNNFVSGLILLVERPIKVGDWIIAGANQGYVKKINVRATEIQTFDHSSVIVPNSELISSPVTNWFFKGRNGRVVINVGVSYDSDPEQVRDLLLQIVGENPGILKTPSPACHFVSFGDSSLDFSLRFFIRDIDYMMSVSSEVRYAIFKRFREEGIEIPFPQRDVNLRDIKQLATALENSN